MSTEKTGRCVWSLKLYGNKNIVTGFADYVRKFVDTEAKPYSAKKDSDLYVVHYSGKRVPKSVAGLLYSNASELCYLDRKKKLVDELINGN